MIAAALACASVPFAQTDPEGEVLAMLREWRALRPANLRDSAPVAERGEIQARSQQTGFPSRIRVGEALQAHRLRSQIDPVCPANAAGTVTFIAVIGRDGAVGSLDLESGDPVLVPAANDAVRRWTYHPTLLNGTPVEVVARIRVICGKPN
jgi:hypothetical protein